MTPRTINTTWNRPGTADPSFIQEALRQASSALPDPLVDRVDLMAYAAKLCERADLGLAYAGDTLAGLIALYASNSPDRQVFISILVVYSDFRSQGIGARLLAEARRLATASSMESLWLKVHPTNLRAQKFYLSHGFTYQGKFDEKIKMILFL